MAGRRFRQDEDDDYGRTHRSAGAQGDEARAYRDDYGGATDSGYGTVQSRAGGWPGRRSLTDGLVRRMEAAFGRSFAGVRVRTDDAAAAQADQMGAKAWARGDEIGFARGEFAPDTREGLHTIAHEFAHVAQVRGGTGGGAGRALGSAEALGAARGPRSEELVEAEADAAADAVVEGRRPDVGEVDAALATRGKRPTRPPAAGTVVVQSRGGGGLDIYFNGNDVRGWSGDPTLVAFTWYVVNAFPRATAAIARACAPEVGVHWADDRPLDPRSWSKPIFGVTILPGLHAAVVAWMQRNQPRLVDPDGAGTLGEGTYGGGRGAESAAVYREVYDLLRATFVADRWFDREAASFEGFLAFTADHRADVDRLRGKLRKADGSRDLEALRELLKLWQGSKLRPRGVAVDPKQAKGGAEPGDGLEGFPAKAKLAVDPVLATYVAGATVEVSVEHDMHDGFPRWLLLVPGHARYLWRTLHNGAPRQAWAEAGRSERFALGKEPGAYTVEVELRSQHYTDKEPLVLRRTLTAMAEAKLDRATFDQSLTTPGAPFARKEGGGLQTVEGARAATPADQLTRLHAERGMIDAMAFSSPPRISMDAHALRLKQLTKELRAAENLLRRHGDHSPYVAHGTFLNRETSEATRLVVMLHQVGRQDTGAAKIVTLELSDLTLEPATPRRHVGFGASRSDDTDDAMWEAEDAALESMRQHWHAYNSYGDGTVHLAVQRKEGTQVKELRIDTANWRKTAKSALGTVATVGGVAMMMLPGGNIVSAGLFLLSSAAGTAEIVIALEERIGIEGGLKFDGRLALDVLALATTVLSAGGFTQPLQKASALKKGMFYAAMLGLTGAQGVLIAAQVREALHASEQSFEWALATAPSPEARASLLRQRDHAAARILGGAVINGGFILVALGGGVKHLASMKNAAGGVHPGVRPEIYELTFGERTPILETLQANSAGRKPLSEGERALLEEALLASPTRSEGAPTVSNDRGAKDEKAADKEAGAKQRVEHRVAGLYEGVETRGDIPGWQIIESPVHRDGQKLVAEIKMIHLETRARMGSRYRAATFERAFDPVTNTFEMRVAFLEANPNKVSTGRPGLGPEGTPTHVYATLRLMKRMGMPVGAAETLKMSGIQNLDTVLAVAQAQRGGMPLSDVLMDTKSVQYGNTTMIQAGKRIVPGSVELSGGVERPIEEMIGYAERGYRYRGAKDPTLVAANDKKLLGARLQRTDVVWWGFDIIAKLVDAPTSPAGSDGNAR